MSARRRLWCLTFFWALLCDRCLVSSNVWYLVFWHMYIWCFCVARRCPASDANLMPDTWCFDVTFMIVCDAVPHRSSLCFSFSQQAQLAFCSWSLFAVLFNFHNKQNLLFIHHRSSLCFPHNHLYRSLAARMRRGGEALSYTPSTPWRASLCCPSPLPRTRWVARFSDGFFERFRKTRHLVPCGRAAILLSFFFWGTWWCLGPMLIWYSVRLTYSGLRMIWLRAACWFPHIPRSGRRAGHDQGDVKSSISCSQETTSQTCSFFLFWTASVFLTVPESCTCFFFYSFWNFYGATNTFDSFFLWFVDFLCMMARVFFFLPASTPRPLCLTRSRLWRTRKRGSASNLASRWRRASRCR